MHILPILNNTGNNKNCRLPKRTQKYQQNPNFTAYYRDLPGYFKYYVPDKMIEPISKACNDFAEKHPWAELNVQIFKNLYDVKSRLKDVDALVTDMLGGDLDNPVIINHAVDIVANNLVILQNDECRKFICSFLRNVKDINADDIISTLSFNLENFLIIPEEYTQKIESLKNRARDNFVGYYFPITRYMDEMKSAAEKIIVRCSYDDIADNKGNISRDAMSNACNIARNSDSCFLDSILKMNKNKDGIIDSNKITHSYYFNPKYNKDQIFEKYKDKNMYKPEIFYDFLKELYENKLLDMYNPVILNEEFYSYGRLIHLLPYLSKTNENERFYNKILNFIKSVKYSHINLNTTDSNNISLLEKILRTENDELLQAFICLSRNTVEEENKFQYTPALDFVYDSIKDEKFKQYIKNNLYLNFKDLKDSIKLQSEDTWNKTKNHLDSPLCDKKETVRKLYDIAYENKTLYFCVKLMFDYPECFSDYDRQRFNEKFKGVFKP